MIKHRDLPRFLTALRDRYIEAMKQYHAFNPNWCMAPGEHIAEWLAENHKTQAWLAKKVPPTH